MRILFAYFDFSAECAPLTSSSLGECALNLSTDYCYSIKQKEVGGSTNHAGCAYVVSRSRKPDEECIKEGFWGERIYNVTAIVGGNGAGKSTILHSMIKAVVARFDPRVPFLLVLQETASKELRLYYGNGYFEPEEEWEGLKESSCEYPDALEHTKTMLIDNTLSYATIDLDSEYERLLEIDRMGNRRGTRPVPEYEDRKQFINKSLVASIRYSNDMSLAGFPQGYEPAVREALAAHFRYEAYQETRFLFDRFQQENIDTLSGGGFSIPAPRYLFVTVLYAEEVFSRVGLFCGVDLREDVMPAACGWLGERGFVGSVMADALINLYAAARGAVGRERTERLFATDDADSPACDERSIAMRVLRRVADCGTNESASSETLKDALRSVWTFVEFVVDNSQTLTAMFEPLQSGSYRVDIRSTVADEQKRRCMIDFLDKYRPASDPAYFLVFASGMSSGEKNFLRMMTQFRYALSGPSVYADDSTEDNTGCMLVNGMTKEDKLPCDTLFLFLDEADLTYHPEWQRVFVSKLTAILPRMFRDPFNKDEDPVCGCKDIQVILATHSPLMLGDFPKASVHYLTPGTPSQSQPEDRGQRMPRCSTFGENLYTILQDSFFMRETVGEFAKQKINAAALWCAETAGVDDDETGEMRRMYEVHRQTAGLLPRGILRSKLIAELEKRRKELGIERSQNLENRLRETMEQNDELRRKLEQANQKLRDAGLLDE